MPPINPSATSPSAANPSATLRKFMPLGTFLDRYILKDPRDLGVQVPGLTPVQLSEQVNAVARWVRALLFPQLLPEERVQLLGADRLGMPQFLLSLRQLLENNPKLARAIGVDPSYLRTLEDLYTQLLTIEAAAEGADGVAQDLRRLLTDRLKRLN